MSDLEQDRVTVGVPAHSIDDEPKSTLRRILIWVAVIAVFVLVAGWLLQRPRYDAKTAPDWLIGEWISDHPDYSDRYLSVTPTSITFATGGTSSVRYSIIGVKEGKADGGDTIVLFIRDVAGDGFQRTVVYDSAAGQMHFASQPQVVWTRG